MPPVAPPTTSVALTAAQFIALLDADLASADTVQGLYIYKDASVIQSPGYAVHDVGTLLKLAPSTSAAQTPAALATLLDTNLDTPDTTRILYIFKDPSSKLAAGDTVDAFASVLQLAPSTSAPVDEDSLADALEGASGNLYAFFLDDDPVGSNAIAVTDATDAINTSIEAGDIPSWGVDVPTHSVRTLGTALIYTTKDVIPTIQAFFPTGTVLQVYSATIVGAELYYQIVAGDYADKYIRYSDVQTIIH